jgi:hypothetical protein
MRGDAGSLREAEIELGEVDAGVRGRKGEPFGVGADGVLEAEGVGSFGAETVATIGVGDFTLDLGDGEKRITRPRIDEGGEWSVGTEAVASGNDERAEPGVGFIPFEGGDWLLCASEFLSAAGAVGTGRGVGCEVDVALAMLVAASMAMHARRSA